MAAVVATLVSTAMPNINYIHGRSFEYQVRNRLRAFGYEVERATGSHGPWDLRAELDGWPTLMIQCKRGKAFPTAGAWNSLYGLAMRKNAIPVIASRIGRSGVRYLQIVGLKERRNQRAMELVKVYNPFGQGVLL